MKKDRILDIVSVIKHYLSYELEHTENFGMSKYKDFLLNENFAVISNEGWRRDGVPVKVDHYAIVLCLKGTCKRTLGPFEIDVAPGTMHFISPRYINSYTDASEDLLLHMVLFKKDFMTNGFIKEAMLDQLVEVSPDIPPFFELSGDNFKTIEELFLKIDREFKAENAFYLQVIKLLILELLYEMNRVCEHCLLNSNRHLSRQYQITNQFKKQVDECFLELRTVQEYAEKLNVTANYLGDVVKNETGLNALQIIHNRLYLEAEYLLSSSPYSIKEIAEKLGFDTASHFSRFFKHYSGFNPSNYKVHKCYVN
jgi:AraC family transcriptional activator of pobA